jgi:acyl-CoA synthetase (NDP forming)
MFDRYGFSVPQLAPSVVATLEAINLPAGSTVTNPIDVPAGALQQNEGKVAEQIIDAVASHGAIDALVIHVNMTVILSFRHVDMLSNIIEAALRIRESTKARIHIALVLRSDGEPEIEERKREYRRIAVARGVPVFDELPAVAYALSCIRTIETFREREADSAPRAYR